MTHGDVKELIELSTSEKEADEILNKYSYCKTESDKIAYLGQLFDVQIISKIGKDRHTDYIAILNAIVNKKWR